MRLGSDPDFSLMPDLFAKPLRPHVHAFGRFVRLAEAVTDNNALARDEKQARLTALEAALSADTASLQKGGWPLPPGTRWLSYWRPSGALEAGSVRRDARRAERVDGVLYAVASETVAGTVETDGDGDYQKTLPIFCGANLVKLVWNNGTCPLVLVYEVERATCVTADITATIQWDDLGLDWELHLVKPGGRINDPATDCTWTTCISSSPDWGVPGDPSDDPHKDIDNTGNYGPENIWLAGPETGRYTVLVEHWGGGQPSSGFVTLNVGGQVHTVAITGLVSRHVWTAATIDWPAGTVTTSQATFDCTASWSSGCTAVLP